jgi:hypothetical protein
MGPLSQLLDSRWGIHCDQRGRVLSSRVVRVPICTFLLLSSLRRAHLLFLLHNALVRCGGGGSGHTQAHTRTQSHSQSLSLSSPLALTHCLAVRYFLAGPPTGELCGSSFWIRFNQRFHRLRPSHEIYTSEIERSLWNVVLAAQAPPDADPPGIRYARTHSYASSASSSSSSMLPSLLPWYHSTACTFLTHHSHLHHRIHCPTPAIRYFAKLEGGKAGPTNYVTCCESQGKRVFTFHSRVVRCSECPTSRFTRFWFHSLLIVFQ